MFSEVQSSSRYSVVVNPVRPERNKFRLTDRSRLRPRYIQTRTTSRSGRLALHGIFLFTSPRNNDDAKARKKSYTEKTSRFRVLKTICIRDAHIARAPFRYTVLEELF